MQKHRPKDFESWVRLQNTSKKQSKLLCRYRLQNMAENLELYFASGELSKCNSLAIDYIDKVETSGAMSELLSAIAVYAPQLHKFLTK